MIKHNIESYEVTNGENETNPFEQIIASYDRLTHEEKEMVQESDFNFILSLIEEMLVELYDYVLVNDIDNKPTFENKAKLHFIYHMVIELLQEGVEFIIKK